VRPLLAAIALLGALLCAPRVARAHADLQQAEPAIGAAVPAPPTALRLRFTEPLDRSATRIEVYAENGARVDRGDLQLGPPNDRLATVELGDLSEGAYTVRWWSLSQVDGHRWQGVYRFGVGRTPPPLDEGAAPLPSPAELLVQWLALIATALVAGILVFRVWVVAPVLTGSSPSAVDLPPFASPVPTAPAAVVVPGAIAVVAMSGAVAAQSRLSRVLRWSLVLLAVASVGELVASLGLLGSEPSAATSLSGLGKAGALALLRLALAPMIGYLAAPSGSPGMALTFVALLALTRGQVGHAAAGGLLPVLLDSAHQLVGAVWVGGAAAFAVVVPGLAGASGDAARLVAGRFARLALAAAGLAVVTGVVNAWALGVDPARLLDSRYGQALAAKSALVALLFAAGAVVHWRRQLVRVGRPLVAELTVGAAVLLAAGSLAVLPPPGETSALPLELVQVAGRDGSLRVVLTLDRVRVGDVRAGVRVEGDGRNVGLGHVRVVASELAPFAAGGAASADAAPQPTEAFGEEGPDGRHMAAFAPFARPGWWRLSVRADVHLRGTVESHFDLVVPDPNRAGLDPPTTDPQAERFYGATLDRLERLRAIRQRDALADGAGGLILSTAEYAAPDRFHLVTGEGEESIAVGGAQAFRRGADPWRAARRSAPFRYPTYRDNYEGATAQRLGHEALLGDVPTRLLTFFVARDRAWYAWWVGRDDGLLHREVMIAPSHYMTSVLDRFDAPADIAIPD